ncbi:MAG: bifunctional oligoribonuclease/PAP phosphatase NrnA [Spirochaetota bacterium]|nr:bifunctional oligoribonuclease/PAP phosphatase NrnA [Spirochaetota bacterium]
MKHIPQEVLDVLGEGEHYIILGHKEPDGDCIGSQLGLGRFLARRGKHVHLVSPGPFQRVELEPWRDEFAPHIPDQIDPARTIVVVVDCSTLERIGYLADEIEPLKLKTVVIDHHSSGTPFGDVRHIDPAAPSVTMMILDLIEELGDIPTREEAGILLFGLATDTGFFRHLEADNQDVFEAVGRLTAFGASPKDIYQRMYGGRSLESKRLLGVLLERTRSYCDGKLIITYETLDELDQFGIENRDSDSLYQQLQGVLGTETILFIREERPGECSVGLRSNADVDVGRIALSFGGGGHAKAAGFSWKGSYKESLEAVLPAIIQAVQDATRTDCGNILQ